MIMIMRTAAVPALQMPIQIVRTTVVVPIQIPILIVEEPVRTRTRM